MACNASGRARMTTPAPTTFCALSTTRRHEILEAAQGFLDRRRAVPIMQPVDIDVVAPDAAMPFGRHRHREFPPADEADMRGHKVEKFGQKNRCRLGVLAVRKQKLIWS
jgi:hypothetical protein